MIVGVLAILAGLAGVVAGVRLATEKPRPVNLAGALLAPAGLALVYFGAARLLNL